MRAIMACLLGVLACVSPDGDPEPRQSADVIVLPAQTEVRVRCEWGCPAEPFIVIDPIVVTPELPAEVVDEIREELGMPPIVEDIGEPRLCGDVYEFSTCCGNGLCESSESAFFCPSDCL